MLFLRIMIDGSASLWGRKKQIEVVPDQTERIGGCLIICCQCGKSGHPKCQVKSLEILATKIAMENPQSYITFGRSSN